MSWRQWSVLVVAVISTVILYNLPRSVVDNDALENEGLMTQITEAESSHNFSLSEENLIKIKSLQNLLTASRDNKKSAIFADSLAGIFLFSNEIDSAEAYADLMLVLDSSLETQTRAGELYFRLFGISSNQKLVSRYARKAGECFISVLKSGLNPDIQAKLAMTKVTTSNPMEGIMMLRSVLEEHPENKTALYSMGVLSMQSGQFDKAVERFEKLLTIDSANDQAAYYLAVSYFELGGLVKSKEWFEKVKMSSIDPAIIESSNQYLKELNEL